MPEPLQPLVTSPEPTSPDPTSPDPTSPGAPAGLGARTAEPVRTLVILARGLGTRMRAAGGDALSQSQATMADRGIKALIDVGRPFLDHVISAGADAGLQRVVLVIGPEHDQIRDYYRGLDTSRVSVEFAVQEQPLGTADAVRAARQAVGDERFVVLNSDNHYPAEVLRDLVAAPGAALVGFEPEALVAQSNIPAERVRAFALVDAHDGKLRSIIEKPDQATWDAMGDHRLVGMNCYLFTPSIFGHIETLQPSARGEYEITDAVRAAVEAGEVFTVVPASVGVLDLSRRDDIAQVTELLRSRQVRL